MHPQNAPITSAAQLNQKSFKHVPLNHIPKPLTNSSHNELQDMPINQNKCTINVLHQIFLGMFATIRTIQLMTYLGKHPRSQDHTSSMYKKIPQIYHNKVFQ
jgi:hypothetical protein